MAYISPLEITIRRISEELIEKQEGQVLQAIYEQGITVNKEELIKALAYDRHQYEQGYEDAKREYKAPEGEWEDHSEEGYVECPFCEHLTNCEDNIDELHYCWNCGAKLKKGGAE